MASTQDILDAAKKIGKLVADHDAMQRLQAVADKLRKDINAQRAMADFERLVHAIAEKESQGQPIEPGDKQKLDAMQKTVIQNPILREFQLAQIDVLDLRRKIDEAIFGGELPEESLPTGQLNG